MIRLAFYGKGGIGKSTIAANVSAAFAAQGKSVLHIGCDPKADSTRTLVSGRIPTIMEQLAQKEDEIEESDVLFTGKNGVFCVEAGGPQAGMGCAGLGITAAVDELERLGILSRHWDVIVYDVLGDVVCGGFSVPMRKHYVDRVYVVTSADYMALYAANNILKGCLHYSATGNLLGGLILNHIKNEQELETGMLFSKLTGVAITAVIEENRQMRAADYQNELFTMLFPESRNALEINHFLEKAANGNNLKAKAMSQEALEQFRNQVFQLEFPGENTL